MVINTAKSWSDAQLHCQSLNGDLASFSSAEEVAGAGLTSSQWTWIGWEYNKVDAQWVWSDGSSTTWSEWASGQPSQVPNSCGMIKGGKLYDWHCDQAYPFVCKIPVQPSPGM